MDLNDFWQENKRWLLGCAAGLVVFLIAKAVIGNVYAASWTNVGGIYREVAKDPKYTNDALQRAKEESVELDAQLTQLLGAMHYDLPEKYQVQGDPELHWTKTYGKVRDEVFALAYENNVDFPEDAFSWVSPAEREQIQRALICVSMVEETVQRLVAAHREVTAKDFGATGLRAIQSFKLDRLRPATRRYRQRDEGIVVEDLVSEVKLRFQFEADNATVHRFLEACRNTPPHVVLDALKIAQGRRPGDPLVVTGEMVALSIKPIPQEGE